MERCSLVEGIGEMKHKTAWRWWSKALGEKASKCDRESDKISMIRTFIFLTYLITNAFIVAGVVRHWNDNQPIEIYIHNEVPGSLPQTKEKGLLKTNSIVSFY
jgi:hypothetical protein